MQYKLIIKLIYFRSIEKRIKNKNKRKTYLDTIFIYLCWEEVTWVVCNVGGVGCMNGALGVRERGLISGVGVGIISSQYVGGCGR